MDRETCAGFADAISLNYPALGVIELSMVPMAVILLKVGIWLRLLGPRFICSLLYTLWRYVWMVLWSVESAIRRASRFLTPLGIACLKLISLTSPDS